MPEQDLKITDAELEILQILWNEGPSTVKEVHESLGRAAETRYTTVLKQLQVMYEKNLVTRDESNRQHVYRPVPDRKKVQKNFTKRFMQSVFGGSAAQMVLHALSNYKASAEELDEIRGMLAAAKSKTKRK